MASVAERSPLLPADTAGDLHAPDARIAVGNAHDVPPGRRTARLLLSSLLALTIIPTLLVWRRPSKPAYTTHLSAATRVPTILAIGDWGRDGCCGQVGVAGALAHIGSLEADVKIVSTGDNFYEDGVHSLADSQWNTSYEGIYNIHRTLRSVPFWPVLGNHDHNGDALAQVAYSARKGPWDMPARFYARELSPHLLAVFLDTTPYIDPDDDDSAARARKRGFEPGLQIAWLKRTLASAPQSHFLVFGHHNMYSANVDGHRGTSAVRDALEGTLRSYGGRVLAYVSGHEHSLQHMRVKNLEHFISGGGSELDELNLLSKHKKRGKWRRKHGVVRGREAPYAEAAQGFFRFRFRPDEGMFEADAIGKKGRVLYLFRKSVPTPGEIKAKWR